MKKIISFILIAVLLMVSCNKKNMNQTSILKQFDINSAIKTADSYMVLAMKNDVKAQEKLYSSKFKKENTNKAVQNLVVNGYKLDEITQAGDMAIIKAKVSKINNATSFASLETQTFQIIKEGNDYRIKDVYIQNEKELFLAEANREIRMRIKNNVKTNLVTNFEGVPKYYYTENDKAKSKSIPVAIGEFGLVGLSFDGNSGFITTKGTTPYIEIVNFDESVAAQGGGMSGIDGGQGSDSSSGGEKPPNSSMPEKPIAKELVPVDIIENATINNAIYSKDNRDLVIQYTKSNAGNSLKMYKCKNGEEVPFDFEKHYPAQKVDVTIVNFVKKGLIYKVTPRQAYISDKSLKSIVGTWELDTEKYKTKLVDESKVNNSD